eukprot:Amastigsp_a508486_77.p3 type:complete len:172 gc:universal Amastigsp_a508486_77:821-306(-)
MRECWSGRLGRGDTCSSGASRRGSFIRAKINERGAQRRPRARGSSSSGLDNERLVKGQIEISRKGKRCELGFECWRRGDDGVPPADKVEKHHRDREPGDRERVPVRRLDARHDGAERFGVLDRKVHQSAETKVARRPKVCRRVLALESQPTPLLRVPSLERHSRKRDLPVK